MYYLSIILLMFILPIVSIFIEAIGFKSSAGIMPLIGKWFVFWAMGARLFTAGLRQALRPRFTAEEILGITSNEPLIIVQELGFANLSIGLLGLITIFNSNWVFPAAIVGALFYGLAGIRHIFNKERNLFENSAMLSDLIIFAVLIGFILWALSLE